MNFMKYLIFILFSINLLTVSSLDDISESEESSNNYCCSGSSTEMVNHSSSSSFSSTIPLTSLTDLTSSTTTGVDSASLTTTDLKSSPTALMDSTSTITTKINTTTTDINSSSSSLMDSTSTITTELTTTTNVDKSTPVIVEAVLDDNKINLKWVPNRVTTEKTRYLIKVINTNVPTLSFEYPGIYLFLEFYRKMNIYI